MTGFEKFLESKGFILINGKPGDFNSYTNPHRTWLTPPNMMELPIQIGLIRIGENNTIGIRFPIIDYIPSEEQYESTLTSIINYLSIGVI